MIKLGKIDEKILIVGGNLRARGLIDVLSEYLIEGAEQSPPEFSATIDKHFWDLSDTSPSPQPDYKTIYRHDKISKRKERYRKLNKKVNK